MTSSICIVELHRLLLEALISFAIEPLQALAELYHIQQPLLDNTWQMPVVSKAPASSHPVSQLHSQQANVQSATPGASQPAAAAAAASFITRQQLGIREESDSATMDDSPPDEDAVGGGNSSKHAAHVQASTPDVMHASASGSEIESPAAAPQPKPLCSQEWQIQHVSSFIWLRNCACACSFTMLSLGQALQ